MDDIMVKRRDIARYRRLLGLQDKHVKDYFDCDGCGLEIEFGVIYEQRCGTYIGRALTKLKECVGDDGKFVEDDSVGRDMSLEIVLDPLPKDKLYEKLSVIMGILAHYENLVFDENCGVHATFRVFEDQKHYLYDYLAQGGYESERYIHSKYKPDFMQVTYNLAGTRMTYEEYLRFQHEVCDKYTSVNFLKHNLVEFRSLRLDWACIEHTVDLVSTVMEDAQERDIESSLELYFIGTEPSPAASAAEAMDAVAASDAVASTPDASASLPPSHMHAHRRTGKRSLF